MRVGVLKKVLLERLWKANIAKSQGFRQTNVFARCVLFKKKRPDRILEPDVP